MRLDASPTSMSPTQDVILVRVTGCQLTSSVRQEGEQADWITHCVISIWFTVMQIALFLALLPAMVSSRCLWTHCLFQLDSLLTSYHNVPRLQTLRVVEWGETWGTFYVTTTTSKQPSWCQQHAHILAGDYSITAWDHALLWTWPSVEVPTPWGASRATKQEEPWPFLPASCLMWPIFDLSPHFEISCTLLRNFTALSRHKVHLMTFLN